PSLRFPTSGRETRRRAEWEPLDVAVPEEGRDVGSYEAVRLFCERAAAALPGFALTEANAAAIGAICRRLDGIPLALELAAPLVRILPVKEVAARLETSLDLVTAGGRSGPRRHQTLRATLEWSYA